MVVMVVYHGGDHGDGGAPWSPAEMWFGLTQAHFPPIGPKTQIFMEKKKKKRKGLLLFGLLPMVHDKVSGLSRMDGWKGWFTRATLGQVSASNC